ncbi:P-loop containing nucleoside triphosphate hydrolase protein [Dendrothele bispora CBS 962.96]|uniref:DNA 3'-5' helicase n=1 Tax=Dendrothele bispora (strain CBS 962.96) TaxID=1314807 RepID=A0A4S8LC80_DENBC|nr:P-loop containing nucleoside triphosphate hydrolase protein [Dendrothele bispora CBS 962.96]
MSTSARPIDTERLSRARNRLAETFGITTLREHQELAGQNLILGISTMYDVPTGGGKTLAFYYPLFYYWEPGNEDPSCQKVVLVISPLTALMDSQAEELLNRGIPAVALHSRSNNSFDELFERTGTDDHDRPKSRIKPRVIFLSPEKALSSEFHEKVLKNFVFKDSCIAVVIDEAHCIIEWGPDFREHYDDLGKLRARLPSTIPVLVASATMPNEVRLSIQYKLGLGRDCAHVAVSNAKPNVALSVAEEIQDFLRDHCPPTTGIPPDKFEFYHRSIDEGRKKIVQDGIRSGFYRCVSATDALGMGMDFRGIKRVILWTEPHSFLSFVQKAGRCTRDFTELGEVILFITKKSYARHLVESELNEELDDGANDGEISAPDDEHDFPAMDRIAAIDIEEEQDEEVIGSPQIEIQQSHRGRKKAATSAIEAKDRRFFSCFIATNQCRRIPWNEFFGNESKSEYLYGNRVQVVLTRVNRAKSRTEMTMDEGEEGQEDGTGAVDARDKDRRNSKPGLAKGVAAHKLSELLGKAKAAG